MNAAQAFHVFASGFGLPAYAATAVPSDAAYPYITYTLPVAGWGEEVAATVDVWYYGDSEAVPNAKAREVVAAVPPRRGLYLPVDGGALWVKRGSPLSQPGAVEDPAVKDRLVNLTVEFLTD